MLKAKLFVFFMLVCMSVVLGCAATDNVIKTANGNYNVVAYGSSEASSRNQAIQCASGHCKKAKQQMVLVSEKTEYKGLLNENFGKAVKVARDVTWAAGQTDTSWSVGAASSGEDYQTRVEFYCE